MHHLSAVNGHERLATVYVNGTAPSQASIGYQLFAEVDKPATLSLGSRPEFCSFICSGPLMLQAQTGLRIFAGQPDPTDESHFTIRYDLDGKSNVIDGWLMPDDTVKLEPR